MAAYRPFAIVRSVSNSLKRSANARTLTTANTFTEQPFQPQEDALKYSSRAALGASNTSLNPRIDLQWEQVRALLLTGDIQLVDVRHPDELQVTGEIPGAINIPLCQVKEALQLPEAMFEATYQVPKPDKIERGLVFYGRGPNASSTALEIAHRLGFKAARHYVGGWEEYSRFSGLPACRSSLQQSLGAGGVAVPDCSSCPAAHLPPPSSSTAYETYDFFYH